MPAGARRVSTERRTVLVVEDDLEIRGFVARTLRETYEVAAVSSAAEALALLADGLRPDLLLCDVMLPGMNGFDLVQTLRARAEAARVPVVFMTARTGVTDILAGINLGARSYIQKPFKMADLVDKVAKAIAR